MTLPGRIRPLAGGIFLNRLIRFIPAIVWMAVIFVLSGKSGSELGGWLPYVNRVIPGLQGFDPMHYAAYFVLALAVAFGLGPLSWTFRGCFMNIAICVLYGITDEWHQSFVPGRSPEWADVWRDAVGSAAAGIMLLIYGRLRRPRKLAKNYRA